MTLLELGVLLRRHLKFLFILPVLCAIVCGVVTLFLPNEYTAQTSMYVLSRTAADQQQSTMYNDLAASQMITNDVATIAQSDRVKADVAQSMGLASLGDYNIKVESSTDTRVITLSVTGTSPQDAANVANAFVDHISQTAQSVMDVESVNVIDQAQAPRSPSGPNRPLYVIVAFLAGLFAAIAIIVIADMANTKVRNSEDVERLLDIPAVGRFPDVS